MKSNYRRIGDFIELVDERNSELKVDLLLGLSINKEFIPSVANTVGTNMKNYKIIRKNQFACSIMQVRRDGKMPVALLQDREEAIISQAYPVFRVVDESELLPQYLMMWFSRKEFDREATFHAVGGVRGSLEWEDFLNFKLPVPTTERQQQIVAEYNTVANRIKLNEQLNLKLEETAQALYKHWFVDFEFPLDLCQSEPVEDPNCHSEPSDAIGGEESLKNIDYSKGYKSSGGKMVYNEKLDKEIPEGWEVKSLSEISKITMGQSPKGESYNNYEIGAVFFQGRTDFGFRIPEVRMYTSEPKRIAKKGDVLMTVRAPVGDLNIANIDCCIGRGIASIRSNENSFIFYVMKNFKQLFDSNNGMGTIFSSINKDELFNLKISYNEGVSKTYNILIRGYDEQILKNSVRNKKLEELQTLLLSKMSNGGVRKKKD